MQLAWEVLEDLQLERCPEGGGPPCPASTGQHPTVLWRRVGPCGKWGMCLGHSPLPQTESSLVPEGRQGQVPPTSHSSRCGQVSRQTEGPTGGGSGLPLRPWRLVRAEIECTARLGTPLEKKLGYPQEAGESGGGHRLPHHLESPRGQRLGLPSRPPPQAGLPLRTHVEQVLLGAVLGRQGLRGIQTLSVDVQMVFVVSGPPGVCLHIAVP